MPHSDAWGIEFQKAKREIEEAWGDAVLDIQHIGSTAIPGVWAKPILDVAVVVRSFSDMDADKLTALGYEFTGAETPERDRYLFVLRSADDLSLRHIHVYQPGAADFLLCVGFRDYLASHLEDAKRYSDLKRALYAKYPDDRYAFGREKQPFIEEIYRKL